MHWYQCVYLVNIPEPLQYHITVMIQNFGGKNLAELQEICQNFPS